MTNDPISGIFLSATNDTITLSHKGEGNPDETYDVEDWPVYLNGKACTLADLQPHDLVKLTLGMCRVDATR